MLTIAGLFFLACGVIFNEWFIELAVKLVRSAFNRPWTAIPEDWDVRRMQLAFLALAAVLIGAGKLMGASKSRLFRRGFVATALLAFLALFVPVATLEVALRPFTHKLGKETALFVKDDRLGWKLRPSTTQQWGGVSVTTNAKGLRGPELPYEKRPGTRRILYLGDSVTFGYMVERWEDTFPYQIETMLEATEGIDVETINSGVGGYSPWQELIYLRDEGLRYDPDLVVVGFVLNDVTEKFTLVRYGGYEESRQLRESYHSRLDVILAHSALAFQVQNFAREWKAKRVLGDDPQLAAIKREIFDVETLMRHPEKEHIQGAWERTLVSVQAIFDLCAERGIPALLVIHPFMVQLDAPAELGAPQRYLAAYARAHNIPFIDLLPVLHKYLDDNDEFAATLYLDHDHLSEEGHRVVARILSEELRERTYVHSRE